MSPAANSGLRKTVVFVLTLTVLVAMRASEWLDVANLANVAIALIVA